MPVDLETPEVENDDIVKLPEDEEKVKLADEIVEKEEIEAPVKKQKNQKMMYQPKKAAANNNS